MAPPSISIPVARNAGLDVLRLSAAIVVVLFHAKEPVGELLAAALGIFAASVAFHASVNPDAGSRRFLIRRIHRLLRPFVVWGCLYGAMRLADGLSEDSGRMLADFMAWLPPQGTLGQLWFLPFAFVVSQGVAILRLRPLLPGPDLVRRTLVLLTITGMLSVAWFLMLQAGPTDRGLRVFLNDVPAVFFGVAIGMAQPARPALVGLAILAGLIGSLLWLAGIPGTLQLTFAIPATAICLLAPVRETALSRLAREVSFPVYLVHVAVIAVLLRLSPLPLGSPGFVLLAVVVALVAGYALQRSPLRRILF